MIRTIIIILLLTRPSYATSWKEYTSQKNMNDFSLCPLFYKMGRWEASQRGSGTINWGRDQTWIVGVTSKGGSIHSETGVSLRSDWSSPSIISSSDKYLVYVGPWYEATLTYPDPVEHGVLKKLFTYSVKKPEQTKKTIRLIAWQRDDALWAYFEEKDEENSKIQEMDLDLWGPIRGLYIHKLCYIKYSAKYGSYNAKPETIRKLAPGILNKLLLRHEILVTGKIIEVKE